MTGFKREGGLMLCGCGHPKAYHFSRALYYCGPMGPTSCALCYSSYETKDTPCQGFVEGEFQGMRMRVDPHAH